MRQQAAAAEALAPGAMTWPQPVLGLPPRTRGPGLGHRALELSFLQNPEWKPGDMVHYLNKSFFWMPASFLVLMLCSPINYWYIISSL